MSTIDRDARHAGELFLAAGTIFLVGTMLAASIVPGYDFHGAAISDLGVIADTAVLFNVVLVVVGILNVAGGAWFFRSHRHPGTFAAFALGGIGAIGAGILPLSTGAPHSLFALLGFVAFNLEAVLTARLVSGPMRWISLLAGAVGLVYVVVMVVGDGGNPSVFGPIGHGGSERMIVYPAMLWLLALGGHLMARRADPSVGSPIL